MTSLEWSAAHWHSLAEEADRKADLEERRGSSGNAWRNKAEMYRRCVVSLYLQSKTRLVHCVCCLVPMDDCLRRKEVRR